MQVRHIYHRGYVAASCVADVLNWPPLCTDRNACSRAARLQPTHTLPRFLLLFFLYPTHQVLVPLLVEAAAPSPPAVPTPALRDMAVKLITSLPAAACGAAFKTQLAAQPAAAKLRLQGALREVATAAASVGAGAAAAPGTVGAVQGQQGAWGVGAAAPGAAGVGGVARKPAIQLKTTFVLPVPK